MMSHGRRHYPVGIASCLVALLLACVLSAALTAAHPGHDGAAPAADDPSVPMPGVVSLDPENFWDFVGTEKGAFVEFYAPWCGHCKQMAGEYAKLGAALQASPKSQEQLVVAKVDGSEHRSISGRFGITGFPTLLYFPPNIKDTPQKYEKARNAEAIIEFLKEKNAALDLFIPKEREYVEEIDASSYDERVTKNTGTNVLVLFYAPWCGHCKTIKPVLNQVARIFERDRNVLILKVNGDSPQNKQLTDSLDVKGFPTMFFYPFGGRVGRPEEYNGGRTVADFVEFFNKRAYTMRLENGDYTEDYGLIDSLTLPLHKMIVSIDDPKALEENYEKFVKNGGGLLGDNVQYYVKLALRIKEDGNTDFLDKELTRLEKILGAGGSGAVAGARRDNMMRRKNILTAVKTGRKMKPVDFTEESERMAKKEAEFMKEMLLSSRLPGVELRYSRLSDARGIAQLLRLRDVMEEEDEGGIPTSAMMKAAGVQDAEDVVDLIQTSFLAITATVRVADQETGSPCATEEGDHVAVVNENGAPAATRQVVAGFLALGTGPRVYSDAAPLSRPSTTDGPAADSKQTYQFPPDRWDDMMRSGVYAGKGVDNIQPSNTLWTSLCVAPSSTTTQAQAAYTGCDNGAVRWSTDRAGESGNVCYSPARLIEEMLTVALSVSSRTSHVLWPLPPDPSAAATEAMLKTSLSADVVPLSLSGVRPAGLTFTGTLLHIRREGVIPALATRPGRIEDYDDFVPLLVRGAGVLTELPEDFFLEEVLKDQDALHKVAIAENPVTHEVVGLICAHVLAPEELQYFTKQYALEPFNKLRPSGGVFVGGSSSSGSKAARDGAAGGCTVRLDFVYFDDRYNGSAHELVRYLLETVFPTCEYLVLTLPHAQLETPLLRDFTYIPIRHYQPHNSRGEFVPVPPGLWVCGRHSTLHVEEFRVRVIATSEERALVEQLLATPNLPNLKQDVAEKLQEDLCVSHEAEHIEQRSAVMRLPPTAVFQLTAPSGETIGLVSARRMRGRDLYALEANYNLDEYLSLYTHTGRDYTATELDDGGNKGSGGTKDCAQAPKRRRRVFPELTAVMLRAVYVKPSFRSWTRFLVREVLRRYVADIACTLTSLGEEPCVALMRELVPAKPRRVVEIEPGGGDLDDDVDEDIGESDEHGAMKTAASSTNTNTREATGNVVTLAALHFTTARFLGDEKRRIHARVVVVGASATGIGFLHALLTTPFAVFTNLVLVSTDGLPPHPNQEPALWRADHLELFEREYLSLQQGSPVRVVPGALVDLDKVNRFVSVDNGSFEPYDYLILAAGRQYVLPLSIRQLLQQEGRTGKKSVIPLNGDLALDRVRQALADIDCNPNNVANVMVYGSGLDALAVAAAMIQERFSSQRVIVCARDAALPPHMDESTYQATSSLFRALGVNVFRGYDVSRMEFDDENNLSSVLLAPVSPETKAGQSVELACCLVVCVEDKDIDANVLSALNKRSIVFDGRVIVNRRYRTTDPRVFAAGPVAMWTRRYGTATPNFEDFSAKDVGSHLAQVLLGHLGFHEFLKLAALSAKRARMTQLQGDTLAHDPAEDIEEAEDDEDDSDWNNANTTTIPNAASAADGLTFNGTCGTDSGRVGSSSRGGSGFKRMSFRSNNNADRSAVSRQLRKKLPTYVTPIARRLRLPSGYHYFSVEAVDARLNDQCEALRCDTVDPSRFSDGEFSPSKHDLAEAAKDENTDHANSSRRPPTGSRQSVVTVYVNRSTRRIDGITYFGLEEPPTGNLRALVGLPETLLNLTFRVKEAQERAAAASRLSEGEHTACPVDEVNLPAHSGLTAGVRRGQLDLLEYLRLPHLQTIFYDRFTDFFRVLEYRTRAHEEAMQLRERILAQHKLDNSLTPEQIAAYQAEMTAKKSGFRYEVQLALLSFLHEHKNFRPNSLYLPNIERVIAAKKARNKSGSHGVTVDPTTTVR